MTKVKLPLQRILSLLLALFLSICAIPPTVAGYRYRGSGGGRSRYYGRGYGSRYGRYGAYRGFGSSLGSVRGYGRYGGSGFYNRGYGGRWLLEDSSSDPVDKIALPTDEAISDSSGDNMQDSATDGDDAADPRMDVTQTEEYQTALKATTCPIAIEDFGPTLDKYMDACKDSNAALEDFCLQCVNPVKEEMENAMFDLTMTQTQAAGTAQAEDQVDLPDLHGDIGEQLLEDRCGMDVVGYMEEQGVPITEDFNEKSFMCLTFTQDKECPADMNDVVEPHVDSCTKTAGDLYTMHKDLRYNPATDNSTVDVFCNECYWPFIGAVMGAGAPPDLLCAVKSQLDNDTATWSNAEMDHLTGIIYDYDKKDERGVQSVLGCLREGRAAMRAAANLTDPLAPHLTTEIRSRCWDLNALNTDEQQGIRQEKGSGPFWDSVNAAVCPPAK